jgi:hypothetical protein
LIKELISLQSKKDVNIWSKAFVLETESRTEQSRLFFKVSFLFDNPTFNDVIDTVIKLLTKLKERFSDYFPAYWQLDC